MNEIVVKFHENGEMADELLKFAVIVTRHENKWVFCRHKERDTYEIPGGHREIGETINDTAERELSEETGAVCFSMSPVCVYSVTRNREITYGKLYFAEISEIGTLSPESEIAEIYYFDILPDKLTYPAIQPILHEKVQMWRNLI